MTIKEYIINSYPEFKDKILYFLDNDNGIICGGFVRSLLINKKWNKELDIFCINFNQAVKDLKDKYPPDKIIDKKAHICFKYENGFSIDLMKPFDLNDFSFNICGLINDNLILLPNIFQIDLNQALHLIDNKKYLLFLARTRHRKTKYKSFLKDWKML